MHEEAGCVQTLPIVSKSSCLGRNNRVGKYTIAMSLDGTTVYRPLARIFWRGVTWMSDLYVRM